LARELGLWIVGGTVPLSIECATSPGTQVSNSSLAFAPDGRCVARYDKMHLFRFDSGDEQFDETRVLQPGAAPVLFELPSRDGHIWRVGMSVCYDLRFPELYRHYAAQGADVMLVPSAFTHTTGQAHWELLLRARAVENLTGIVAPAQGGLHENGRRTWGHSMIVDPWGVILGQCPQGEAVVIAELDARRVAQCRAQLPALAHRRL
jgi:nitrilase